LIQELKIELKEERRRFPRCYTNIKAYFPSDEKPYRVSNVSYRGCFICTNKKIPRRKLIYFEIEIPDVGRIPIYGIVVHHGTSKNPGLGIEIIEIDKNLTPVWGLYIKALGYINKAREIYEKTLNEFCSEKESK